MNSSTWNLKDHGFCLLKHSIDTESLQQLRDLFEDALSTEASSLRARSSRGHVYAARNIIEAIPEVSVVWQTEELTDLLSGQLGRGYGLVRALFFDKPPERTWSLPWHKDTSIAVKDHERESAYFSRPTLKSGVPHVIASDDILRDMLTLRIHIDAATSDNGPLRVIPGSHLSSDCQGVGVDHAITVYADAGDVLAMRPLLSHSSGVSAPNTQLHRRVLHLEFAARESLPDGYQWQHFIRP
jgi:ectoine hydroxylase-related dioxygenase (phytanoyl-CoA dioxygenase family)